MGYSTHIEYLPEVLIYDSLLQDSTVRLYEKQSVIRHQAFDWHTVAVVNILPKYGVQRFADWHDTLAAVLCLAQMYIMLVQMHVPIPNGKSLRHSHACTIKQTQDSWYGYKGSTHSYVIQAATVGSIKNGKHLLRSEDVWCKVRLRLLRQTWYETLTSAARHRFSKL